MPILQQLHTFNKYNVLLHNNILHYHGASKYSVHMCTNMTLVFFNVNMEKNYYTTRGNGAIQGNLYN